MKNRLISILLFLTTASFGQSNYYRLINDSIYNERDFKSRFETTVKNLPTGFKLVPTIYHKYVIKDSIINYVLFMGKKSESKDDQSKFELVFKQDPLFLLLNKKLSEFKLNDLNGKTFSSSQLLGKPTLINFWSINCPPCIEEFAQLDKLKEKYGDKINFIAICEDTREQAMTVLKRKPFNFYQLIDGDDYKTNTLEISSVPKNIFLDRNGLIREIKDGLPFEKDKITGKETIGSNLLFEKILEKIYK